MIIIYPLSPIALLRSVNLCHSLSSVGHLLATVNQASENIYKMEPEKNQAPLVELIYFN